MVLLACDTDDFNLWQIEAIAQDEAAQGCISSFDALNIRLENQVNHSPDLCLSGVYLFIC